MPPRIVTLLTGRQRRDSGANQGGGRLALASFYAAQFGHLGIVLPFLAPWLAARRYSAAEIGALLA